MFRLQFKERFGSLPSDSYAYFAYDGMLALAKMFEVAIDSGEFDPLQSLASEASLDNERYATFFRFCNFIMFISCFSSCLEINSWSQGPKLLQILANVSLDATTGGMFTFVCNAYVVRSHQLVSSLSWAIRV